MFGIGACRRGLRGFTLIELMVSSAIGAIVILITIQLANISNNVVAS